MPPSRVRSRSILVVALIAMAVLAASCQFSVTSAGTTFALSGNELEIVVLPGSVDEDVTMHAVGVPEPAGAHTVPWTAFDISPQTGWALPVSVRIGYRVDDLPGGINEDDLVMVRLEPGGWSPVPGSTLDTATDTVHANLTVLGALAVGWEGCDRRDPETCTLRESAPAGMRIGATLEPAQILDATYTETLTTEFGALTPENALKMYSIQNQRGAWTFAGADAVVGFAQANGLAVRGHTLVWAQDQYTPAWVAAITDPAELQAVTDEYITTVMSRYGGEIPRWDVVNEPLATFGTTRSGSVWDDLLGPDWIADAFHLAHATDPAAELWINEYATDWMPGKHAAFLALVSDLVADGVPIDGVGLQTHRLSPTGPDPATFEQQLRDFTDLGLDVAITELDVVTNPTDASALTAQAGAYTRIVDACLAVERCVEITTWGITDADTWLDSLGPFPPPTRPLLFDGLFAPKPAYEAMRASLAAGRPDG